MDPNAALMNIAHCLSLSAMGDKDAQQELSDTVDDLREWLSAGEFEPDWRKLPTAAHYYKTVTASSHLVTMGSRLRDYPAPTGPTWLCEQATPEQCFWPSNP